MALSRETLDEWERSLCLPLSLLLNFALFQYLLAQYHRRLRELRGFTLLLCAFGGFVLLIPFANSDTHLVKHFGVISEACSILTFLLQLTIVGRDINRKICVRSLLYLTYASEIFILMGLIVALLNLLAVAYPPIAPPILESMASVAKKVALFFIFFSRFYFLLAARGRSYLRKHKKAEMAAYTLFVTYEYPFMALEAATELSWANVKALWLRFTILMCILMTLHEKLRANSSAKSIPAGGISISRGGDKATSLEPPQRKGKMVAVVPLTPTVAAARETSKRTAPKAKPPLHPQLPPDGLK